jgi:gamma-glutamylputrescine oxidase
MFNYLILTHDRRIVMGGAGAEIYNNDAICSGNDKNYTHRILDELYSFFPQLDGLEIEHAWGGTTSYIIGRRIPSVGVIGDHKNIYYGAGLSEGVPTTQTFGRIISDLMAGESNKFTNHYVVNHKVPYAGPARVRGSMGRVVTWMWEKNDQ